MTGMEDKQAQPIYEWEFEDDPGPLYVEHLGDLHLVHVPAPRWRHPIRRLAWTLAPMLRRR